MKSYTMESDTSSVFHIDMLDKALAYLFSEDKPWCFETESDLLFFVTEDEACTAQRSYRESLGFHPETGERK